MKKIIIRILTSFLLILVLIGGLIFYGFKIEPFRLKVNEYTLKKTEAAASSLTIAQISDLHIKQDFTSRNLKKVVDRLNQLKPDIVLFTGDLYDNYSVYHDDEHVTAELKRIEAGYAKLAVWGNRDYGGGAVRQYASIMADAGFTLLKNESTSITLESGGTIRFTGLDDALLGNPGLPDLKDQSTCDYSILFMHEPDIIDRYVSFDYDTAFSGHSHGGQVKLPFMKGITTALGEKYTEGFYRPDPESGRQLYVNTGIGTTRISVRFHVVPEIALFRIYL